jgi:hypothetical protein
MVEVVSEYKVVAVYGCVWYEAERNTVLVIIFKVLGQREVGRGLRRRIW